MKNIKMIGFITEDFAAEKVQCPICKQKYYIGQFPDAEEFMINNDEIEMGKIVCDICHNEAEKVCGDGLMQLLKDGELDFYEDTVREIFLLNRGAKLHLNA